jgi:hypothetical protein
MCIASSSAVRLTQCKSERSSVDSNESVESCERSHNADDFGTKRLLVVKTLDRDNQFMKMDDIPSDWNECFADCSRKTAP